VAEETSEFGEPWARIGPDSAFAPFRWRPFRNIWGANLTSALGASIQMIGASWLMTELTDSHTLVAMVQTSIAVPVFAFGIFAGVIADNYDRRLVMVNAHIGMLLTSACLAALAWLDAVTPWMLLLFTFLLGVGFAVNGPAWQASVRLMVPRSDLPQAISLNSIAFNMARSLGPAVGGVLLTLWGPKLAFSVNTITYLAMIVVLLRWQPRSTSLVDKHPVFPAIWAAMKFCAGSSSVRRTMLRSLVFCFGGMGFPALLPVVAREQVGGAEIGFGIMLGSFGLGAVLIAIWLSPLRRRFGPEAIVSIGMIVAALCSTGLAFTYSLVPAVVVCLLAGMGHVATMASLNVSMQMRSPDELVGRCLALFQAIAFGGIAVGAWAWGALSAVFSIAVALNGSAIFLLVMLAALRILAPVPGIGER
jgi:MFS family permease